MSEDLAVLFPGRHGPSDVQGGFKGHAEGHYYQHCYGEPRVRARVFVCVFHYDTKKIREAAYIGKKPNSGMFPSKIFICI